MKKRFVKIFMLSLLLCNGLQFNNNENFGEIGNVYGNVLSIADESYIHNQLLVKTITDMNIAYDDAGVNGFSFPAGYAAVKKNNRYSYIDINGNLKYPWPFYSAGIFHDGRIMGGSNDYSFALVELDKNYTYLFKTFQVPSDYDYPILLGVNDDIGIGDPGWGVVEHDGVRGVYLYFYDEYEEEYGIKPAYEDPYETQFKYLLGASEKPIPNPPNYQDIRTEAKYYSEGLRAVKWSNGWGFVDKNGNVQISPQYPKIAGGLSNGLIAVQKNGKWGYINSNNETVIPFIYDNALGFDYNRALVKKDGLWHIIKHPTEALNQSGISNSNLADFTTNIIKSNITFDTNVYSGFQSVNDHINYLSTQIASVKNGLNSAVVSEVNNYVTTIINKIEPIEISVNGSNIHILSPNYKEVLKQSQELYSNLENVLSTNNLMNTEMYEKLQPLTKGLGSVVSADGSPTSINNVSQYSILELSNVTFDVDTYSAFTTNDEHISYLEQQLNSVSANINKLGLEEIEKYIEYILNGSNVVNLKAKKNVVNVTYEDNAEDINRISELNKSIDNILNSKNIVLNKKVENNIIFNVSKIDLEKAVTYKFSSDLLPYLDDIDGIRLIISSNYNGLYIKSQDLISNINMENLAIDVNYSNNSNIAVVVKNNNEIVYKSESKFFITASAQNQYSTVFSTIDNTTQNWGGQFNPNINTIEFATNFTGSYEIKDNNITINDISHLSEDLQNKIKFMVSKGIFNVDGNGNFNPDNTVQRYHFITALVILFFSVDGQATADFTDVPTDNPYYKMVASAKLNEITNGYEDNTFRGENIITRDEVVAFVSRKLAEEKGYKYPDNVDSVLSVFKDYQNIYDWSKKDIALALDHGIIKTVGDFGSKDQITRLETLELLHTLFTKLYVNPELPVNTESNSGIDSNTTLFLVASGCVVLIGLGIGSIVINKGKN